MLEQQTLGVQLRTTSREKHRWPCACAIGMAALAGSLLFAPGTARADGPAPPTGKGIAGGILLGAEIVMIPIAAAGVEQAWPYPVFGALGAGAGAVGGWGVEKSGSTAASVYLLAGGMALVIPTLVAVLNVTVYNSEEDEEKGGEGDQGGSTTTTVEVEKPGAAPSTAPAAAPGAAPPTGPGAAPGAAPVAPPGAAPSTPPGATPGGPTAPIASRHHKHRRSMPLAFVGVDERGVRPGVPGIAIYPLYTDVEVAKYGATQGTEVRVPLVSGSF